MLLLTSFRKYAIMKAEAKMNPWILIILLSLPWDWHYLPVALQAPTWCHYAAPCGSPDMIGWYDGQIHVVHCSFNAETRRRYVHELDHYLVHYYGMTEWDWGHFVSLVRAESAAWPEHQQASIESMLEYGGAQELHADLMNIIGQDIPPSLAPWYPWFSLSRVATS